MMRHQVLIATMHQTNTQLLDTMNIRTAAIVINQCDQDYSTEFIHNGHRILWINTRQRGLSKSRNMALSYASAEICTLADDDMVFHDDMRQRIWCQFQHNNLDVACFRVDRTYNPHKQYAKEAETIGLFKSFKISSVEISFRRQAIVNHGILFNERIGAGSVFQMGEENVFLLDCLRRKLKIMRFPDTIAQLTQRESSWFHGYDETYFMSRGAAFKAMELPYTTLLVLQFALRKHPLYKSSISFHKALWAMIRGMHMYRSYVDE